jgi:hypothetical protein
MGGGVALAVLSLHLGQTADTLACAARSQSSAKMGGLSGACFAWLGLLGSICMAFIGVEPLTRQLPLHAPGPV